MRRMDWISLKKVKGAGLILAILGAVYGWMETSKKLSENPSSNTLKPIEASVLPHLKELKEQIFGRSKSELYSGPSVSAEHIEKKIERLLERQRRAEGLEEEDLFGFRPKNKLSQSSILKDSKNRIGDEFTVSDSMYHRVSFWFDVYTKHPSTSKVIHHSNYPWVVFDVFDTAPLIEKATGPKWRRIERAEAQAFARMREIRSTLKRLANRSSYKNLKGDELTIYNMLKVVPGKRRTVLLEASRNVRIQTGQQDHFVLGISRASEYFPMMEEIFSARGLPTELTRLPLVESSFNVAATSKVGAVGVWQFMPKVGRKMMLINSSFDERRNPLKSTDAAARLMKENYQILWGEWPLAITAYNHGPGGVRKAVRTMGTRDLGVIADKYQTRRFSFASSNFYACFLAALHAEKYKEHIFDELELKEPLNLKELALPRKMRPNQLLKLANLDREEFLKANPEVDKAFRKNLYLPKGFKILVPEHFELTADDLKSTTKAS